MPTAIVKEANRAFVERLEAGFQRFGYGQRGGVTEFARIYAGGKKNAPMVTDWRKGRYMPGDEYLLKIAEDWSCSFEWLKFGRGPSPSWIGEEPATREVHKPRRYADGDVIALQIGIESLTALVLANEPESVPAYLADLKRRAGSRKFGDQAGLLQQLQRIAREVPPRAAAASPQTRPRGSVPSKRR